MQILIQWTHKFNKIKPENNPFTYRIEEDPMKLTSSRHFTQVDVATSESVRNLIVAAFASLKLTRPFATIIGLASAADKMSGKVGTLEVWCAEKGR